jgi:hypothetical protein
MRPEHWCGHFRMMLLTALCLAGALYAFILVLDPYQNVPFSPDFERAPIDTNQRFSYPAIARRADLDSAVFGTSTTRLLDPRHLDRFSGARFANLSMNGATAWEETQLFMLFNRHHPRARHLVFGIDTVWCEPGTSYEETTFRTFPRWMYDEDPWNDLLYLFDDKALENAVRQLEFLRGERRAKYEPNGYRDFVPDLGVWSLERARAAIYGRADFDPATAPPAPEGWPSLREPGLRYPTHALMQRMLAAAPRDAQKILVLVPYHVQFLRNDAVRMTECKGRLVEIAAGQPNTHVVDFMIPSELTARDEHYWDVLHYSTGVAREIERMIFEAADRRQDRPGYYRYLTPARIVRQEGA